MAEKDKLSKDVEEQIQSLASDVYIQIEEKLTQLMCTVTPKEWVKEVDIVQDPVYLKLQDTYQASQNEFTEKSKNLSEQIKQLAQNTHLLKKQLDDAVDKNESIESDFQVELTKEKERFSSEKQSLEADLNRQVTSFQLTIKNLEQVLSAQKDKLHQAQTQAEEHDQQLQNQIVSTEKSILEQQQEIVVLNERLLASIAQEQGLVERLKTVEQQRNNSDDKRQEAEKSWKNTDKLNTHSLAEQKNTIKELTKQLNTLMIDLEQSEVAGKNQQKIVSEQQRQLVDINEVIKQKTKNEQGYKHEIKQLNNEQSKIKKQQLIEQKSADLQHEKQQQAQAVLQQQISSLEINNQALTDSLIVEQSGVELYQKEVSSLKSQLKLAQQGQERILTRFNASREKQEKDNDQIRETIKYLRDENNNMITQNNIEIEKSIERISELENKLTEYRLKFEYAQKQLTQNS